jgi:putative cardiolipin synthase
VRDSAEARDYLASVRDVPLVRQMLAGTLPMEWVPARVLADDPAKVLHPPQERDLHMGPLLEGALGRPQRELLLVSPYFVPTQEGSAALVDIARRGVKVRVLTNSLGATDVTPVYAGYSRYREELLRGGIELHEMKARPPGPGEAREHEGPGGSAGGSSGASLHAKTFAVDRQRVFVGSFNLDPRSARLNTEMGVVMDSPELAARVGRLFDEALPRLAYEMRLADSGETVEWVEQRAEGEVRHATAPGVGLLKRIWAGLLSILPIEWLL